MSIKEWTEKKESRFNVATVEAEATSKSHKFNCFLLHTSGVDIADY